MTEPIHLESQASVEPRTERLADLFKPVTFEKQNFERGGNNPERQRDALLAARLPDGQAVQLFVQATYDTVNQIMKIEIVPTGGAISRYPDIKHIKFNGSAKVTPAEPTAQVAFQQAIQQLEAAGYTVDPTVKN